MFRVQRYGISNDDVLTNRHQWPVRFDVTYSEDDTAAKVFVMQQSPDVALFSDSLSCVANAIQMTDLPEDAPEEGSPYYRVSSIIKLCRSPEAADEFVEKVEFAIQDLANNLQAASDLSVASDIVITPS